MNDDSGDHLAPVSYLPWAAPGGDHPAGRGRVGASGAASNDATDGGESDDSNEIEESNEVEIEIDGSNERSAGASMPARRPSRADAEHRDRGRRGGSGGGDGGRLRAVGWGGGSGGAARRSVVDDDPIDESGAERDARIDRLVVSRLRRSALSIAEVRAVLGEHGLDEGEIDEWIERYERLGYLDDARLAEQLTHSHGTRRGRGSTAILHELERRGIEGQLARAAVDGLDHDAELENATAVAERRARQLTGLDHVTAERRLMAFLLRRGYPSGVVREAVTAALSADGS